MKRNILWIVAACLLCLGFTSCQEPDEPSPLMPVLHLDEAQDVTATTACVGNYNNNSGSTIGEFYYLFSTNENFQDSLVYEAELNSSRTIYGLRPNTTYFYKMVGTDGNITINSEVKSFTTLKGFSIAKLTYTDWDGEVKEVDTTIIHSLLKDDFLPVICPIGYDDDFHAYNINADDAACAIAEAVHAEKLVFLSDIEGVYKDKDDPNTLISELHVHEAEKLISEGYVGGGMIPKLQNCIDAIEEGVNRVHILDGRIPHSLLLEIFTNKGIGTAILREDGEKYYNEHE